MPLPTFFLAGAPKAGTTSLFAYLAAHPEVGVSAIKEPCYFAPDIPVDAEAAAARASWDAYQALFAGADGRRAIGEGSVAYFASRSAAANIRARVPNAEILLLLRDPAARVFAHYKAARVSGAVRAPFREWLTEQRASEPARTPGYGAVWAGFYGQHLDRWLSHFPMSRLHLFFYEDFVREPARVVASVFTAIGVDPTVPVDLRVRHNETTQSRVPSPVRRIGAPVARALPAATADALRRLSRRPVQLEATPAERAEAIAVYADDIRLLARRINRNLDAWLDLQR